MKLQIDRQHLDALVIAFPRLAYLQAQLRLGNKAELEFAELRAEESEFLQARYAEHGQAARAAQLQTLQQALSHEGLRIPDDDLEAVVPEVIQYLAHDIIRGWLFTAALTGKPLAFAITRIDYTPKSGEESAKVLLELRANAKGKLATSTLRINPSDIPGRTVAEIFAAKGFVHESPALMAAYEAGAERYFDWRARSGEQFSAMGTGFFAENPVATHRDTDWSRKDLVVLSSSGSQARLVNDENILADRALTMDAPGDILDRYIRRAEKNGDFKIADRIKAVQDSLPPDVFTQLPVHFYILMFHLDLHHYVWVHVDDMAPYHYLPELKQKLILPEEQTDLIDILTAEMDVLMDDIVAGKSGGTTVLCAGPPGVGKTLTAEVYSEIIRRPLYRVHSGQLGLNVAAMETTLKEVLTRAQRWGAVMLIDEADVYIKRRDDNIAMNAVVGVFLRVLEYFNGLLFLTTNRVDDIDEAIVSRCIALIRYEAPDADARHRIWRVMAEQFSLALDEALIIRLVHRYPEASGRDIKGLTKLVAKYCRRKAIAPDMAAFDRCAMFRAMTPATEEMPENTLAANAATTDLLRSA